MVSALLLCHNANRIEISCARLDATVRWTSLDNRSICNVIRLDHSEGAAQFVTHQKKPEVTVIMGYDTMVPTKRPGAGKQVMRPFTDIWAKRSAGWQLIARQATIAETR